MNKHKVVVAVFAVLAGVMSTLAVKSLANGDTIIFIMQIVIALLMARVSIKTMYGMREDKES